MRRTQFVGLGGLILVLDSLCFAQEPGVITPEELERGARDAYQDQEYGFSILKSSEWTLYGSAETVVLRPSQSVFGGEGQPVSREGLSVAILRFPANAGWVLVNPRVLVDVYRMTEPFSADEVMSSILQDFQASPADAAQVSLPPVTVEMNGRKWLKAGLFMKVPLLQNSRNGGPMYMPNTMFM